jgi:hypothetical protein
MKYFLLARAKMVVFGVLASVRPWALWTGDGVGHGGGHDGSEVLGMIFRRSQVGGMPTESDKGRSFLRISTGGLAI